MHDMRPEGDVLHVVFHGPMRAADVAELRRRADEMITSAGRCLLLCDLRNLSTIDSDARRAVAEWGRASSHQSGGTAVYGASMGARVLTTLIVKAVQLLGNHDTGFHFANNEAEARAWLTTRRATLDARATKP